MGTAILTCAGRGDINKHLAGVELVWSWQEDAGRSRVCIGEFSVGGRCSPAQRHREREEEEVLKHQRTLGRGGNLKEASSLRIIHRGVALRCAAPLSTRVWQVEGSPSLHHQPTHGKYGRGHGQEERGDEEEQAAYVAPQYPGSQFVCYAFPGCRCRFLR